LGLSVLSKIILHVQRHPLRVETEITQVDAGQSIYDIVSGLDLPCRPVVSLAVNNKYGGVQAWEIPADQWLFVKPRAGVRLYLFSPVRDGAAGLAASVMIAAFAPWAAGAMGFATGTLGFAAATSAISLIGSLAIGQLIPPAPQVSLGGGGTSIGTSYAIAGASNELGTEKPYPKVLGRRRIAPPMSATGWTEIVDGEVYYRGRYAIGWGPLCLDAIEIGGTAITSFTDVEIEFLNVDQAETLSRMPDLASLVTGWRSGEDPLTLYPADITQDGYNVQLEFDEEPIVRNTRANTTEAVIVIGWPSGLFRYKTESSGLKDGASAYKIEYRAAGSDDYWTLVGDFATGQVIYNAGHLEKHSVQFPSAGEWEIRLTRAYADYSTSVGQSGTYLTAIQSHSGRDLPSHSGIAEMAVRIKATNQINGQLDNLTVIAQQMAPVWDGAVWSSPVPVRHPAWVFADMLTGYHLGASSISPSRVAADDLKAWADDEPHWTCDYVISDTTTVKDALDLICAAGRARRTLRDLQWSVVREETTGVARQVFTPENYKDFGASIVYPKRVHAFRANVVSEDQDWSDDQVVIYADGYDETTATVFETIDLPGVVVGAGEAQGNAWRLGRYFMAVAQHRRETYRFTVWADHLRVTHGDRAILIAPSIEVHHNGARVVSVTSSGGLVQSITLDEPAPTDATGLRLQHRSAAGDITAIPVTADPADDRVFVLDTPTAIAVAANDLCGIESRGFDSCEVIVTQITPDTATRVQIVCMPAAPEVLQADQGAIPAYTPLITADQTTRRKPPRPTVVGLTSDQLTARRSSDGALSPRASVSYGLGSWSALQYVRLRWRPVGTRAWSQSERIAGGSVILTGDLERGAEYQVSIATEDQFGRSRGWVDAGTVTASVRADVLSAPVGWYAVPDIAAVTLRAADGSEYPDDFAAFHIYGAETLSDPLVFLGATPIGEFRYQGAARVFAVRFVDLEGREGDLSGVIEAAPRGLSSSDFTDQVVEWDSLAENVANPIATAQAAADGAQEDATQALEDAGTAQSAADAARGVADGLRTEFDVEASVNSQRQIALEQAQENWLDLVLAYGDVKETIADAGIVVDPDTGSVEIAAIANVEGRVQQVEIDLSAIDAQIGLKASVAEVDSKIAAAQLPEASIADLEGTKARVSDVEIGLDAVNGALTLSSTGTLYDVNDAEVGITALKGAIDIAQGQIDLRATKAEFDALSDEVTNAQIEISSLDGAAIRQSAQDTREFFDLVVDQSELQLDQVLGEYEGREAVRRDIALARQDLTARFNESDESVARVVQQITSEVDGNRADILSEGKTRASEVLAVSRQVDDLSARVGTSEGKITQLNKVTADSDSVLARSVFSIDGRVGDAEGSITALNTVSTSSSSVLARTVATMSATVDDSEAAITAINTVSATSDSAIARAVNGLSGRVGDAEGDVTELNKVNVNSTSALVQAFLSVRGRVDDAEGEITQLNKVDATSTSALVQSLLGLDGRVGDTEGEISDLYNVDVSLKNALVQKILEIESTVGGKTFTVRSLMESVDGIEGQWGVEVDNNGRITGVALVSDPSQRSNFIVLADAFKVVGPDSNVAPFVVRTTEETQPNGDVYPPGIYVSNAYIDAARVIGTLKSDNFDLSGETGWRIKADGTAHFFGPVLSRPLVVAEGSHNVPNPIVINSATWSTRYESGLINSGFMIDVKDVWLPADAVYKVEAAFNGSGTGLGIGDGTQEFWEAKAELVKAARWTGPQQFRLRLWVEGVARAGGSVTLHKSGNAAQGGAIEWKIYKVT
jgi:hypothetical protein